MCARFGRGSAVVVCAPRCACRLDLANIHRHAHHSNLRRWSCGATWSDMKRTCAICHEYSWHAPFVSSNSMVVVTDGGPSCSGRGIHRHMHLFAPFLGLLGAERLFGPTSRSWRQSVASLARRSLPHFCARLSPSLSRLLPSSKSEHHATSSSLPLRHTTCRLYVPCHSG